MAGRIVTFYSYKGGTGRSMALANFAWLLAASGKKVLTIDWDLEAPGLHRYFRPFLTDFDLTETDGLIDAAWALAGGAMANTQRENPLPPEEERIRIIETLGDATRRLRPVERLDRQPDLQGSRSRREIAAVRPLFPSGGFIDFIGAGRQGPTYSTRVNTFAWQRFYDLDGARVLETATQYFRDKYDWTLIDSRTGVSDTAGICTIQMPDTVVACFTPNRQSIMGVADVLRSIRTYKAPRTDGSTISFYPLASRIENLEPQKLEASRAYYRNTFAEFLPVQFRSSQRDYWDRMEIPYKTGYAFEETLAAFGDATGALGAADTMLSYVERMGQQITGDTNLRIPEILDSDRRLVLAKYALDTKPADKIRRYASNTERESASIDDSEILRNVHEKEQVWRTGGYRWRSLLSRREIDMLTPDDREKFGRSMTFFLNTSEQMQQFLRRCDSGFGYAGGIALAGAILTYVGYWPLQLTMIWPSSLIKAMELYPREVYPLIVAYCGWGIVSMIFTVVLSSSRPHGVRLMDTLSLILIGPFRREIRDYKPSSK